MRRIQILTATVLLAATAAGCTYDSKNGGSFGEALGISAQTPDEFLIVANQPLLLPPNFSLPEPTPGVASRIALDPLADAHTALFNRPDPIRLAQTSRGEEVLLSGADADGDNAVIRQVLADEDTSGGERRFGLTSFGGFAIPATLGEIDAVLEPVEETDRLRNEGFLTPTAPPVEDDG
jgi:hypothetical protein